MIKRTILTSLILIAFAFAYPYLITTSAFAASDCEILQGYPNAPTSAPPPPCVAMGGSGINGLSLPPNLQPCPGAPAGYFKMPEATDGSYIFETPKRCGSKELIGMIYTVAKAWKHKYPSGKLELNDLTAGAPHNSHKYGIGVDMNATTNGKDHTADMSMGNYNRKDTIVLGKMFVDTNILAQIWYNDQAVNNEVLTYAKSTGKSSLFKSTAACPECNEKHGGMNPLSGHDNHFHVDVARAYLPVYAP
jgi:hypothetical protein